MITIHEIHLANARTSKNHFCSDRTVNFQNVHGGSITNFLTVWLPPFFEDVDVFAATKKEILSTLSEHITR